MTMHIGLSDARWKGEGTAKGGASKLHSERRRRHEGQMLLVVVVLLLLLLEEARAKMRWPQCS